MSTADLADPPNPAGPAPGGVRLYTVWGLIALGVLVLPLLARGLEEWSFFPSMVGCLVLVARWRSGPILFLLSFLWLVLSDQFGVSPLGLMEYLLLAFVRLFVRVQPLLVQSWTQPLFRRPQPVLDALTCAAVLAAVACQFRLLSITYRVFPRDRRLRRSPVLSGRTA